MKNHFVDFFYLMFSYYLTYPETHCLETVLSQECKIFLMIYFFLKDRFTEISHTHVEVDLPFIGSLPKRSGWLDLG